MRLQIPEVDGRGSETRHMVTDVDTGKIAGYVDSKQGHNSPNRRYPSWHIVLFDKYHGSFETRAECQAFAEGIQAVINHAAWMDPKEWGLAPIFSGQASQQ
jgi:hypothetical protein